MKDWSKKQDWEKVFQYLKEFNPNMSERRKDSAQKQALVRPSKLQKVLVANRGEIAKRFFFALHEEGIPSVAIVTDADLGQSWYDFADEVVIIGDPTNYTNIHVVIAAALMTRANAIYPGYGFLSENSLFAETIILASKVFKHEIIFMGPKVEVMHRVSDKIKARNLASDHNIPLLEGAQNLKDIAEATAAARKIGYPVIVKLSAGGGGRGIIPVFEESELAGAIEQATRMGASLYNDDTYYIEKFVQKPVHMEVQIFNGWAIGVRKCAVQRRNQKIIEESGHTFLDDTTLLSILSEAQKMAQVSGYNDGCGAGTVEFLLDAATGKFGFLEVNTRLQVEYAVTEMSLGIDLVKWQILQFDGRINEVSYADVLKARMMDKDHTIEVRIYAEEPQNDYQPSPGQIQELILPTFNGVRCDFGFAGSDRIASMYDAMIGKIITFGKTRQEALIRLDRALQELYVKGFNTNIKQLMAIVRHPKFIEGDYTNNLLSEYPELQFTDRLLDSNLKKDRRGRSVVIFGALTEYLRIYHEMASDIKIIGGLGTSLDNKSLSEIPYKYRVKYLDRTYAIEVYQVSLEKFYVLVDGQYNGKILLSSVNVKDGDYIFRWGTRSYRIRADKRLKHISLRLKDNNNKTNYYRLQINPEGIMGKSDPAGMARAPFQCTFVSLGKEPDGSGPLRIGSSVKKGDTILIISSMKMETKMLAPADGRIEYLIEDGNLSKLMIGNTSDGKVLGRSIQEGEVLFLVKPRADQAEEKAESDSENSQDLRSDYPTQGVVLVEDIEKKLLIRPNRFIDLVLELLQGAIQGYIFRENIIHDIDVAFEKLPSGEWEKLLDERTEKKITSMIMFYTYIRQLFSPVIKGGFSFFEELNQYIENLDNFNYKPSFLFKNLIDSLFELYGRFEKKSTGDAKADMIWKVFLHIQRSYFICNENKNIIKNLVRIISYSNNKLPDTISAIKSLMQQEQSELDDTIGKFAADILAQKFSGHSENLIFRDAEAGFDSIQKQLFDECGVEKSEILPKLKSALKKPEKSLLPENIPAWAKDDLKLKLSMLEEFYKIGMLYSPYKDVIVYSLESKADGVKTYISFGCVNDVMAPNSDLISFVDIEACFIHAIRLMLAYFTIDRRDNGRIEILALGETVPVDVTSNNIGHINFMGLEGVSLSAMKYFSAFEKVTALFHFDIKDSAGNLIRKIIEFTKAGNSIKQDILANGDIKNPYAVRIENNPSENLYRLGKWPIDVWAGECFDLNSYSEITIDSIDGAGHDKPAAARIFIGKILGCDACFYMKDSRINGGATGSREGLKYLAAVYLGYLKGIPVYVWNDGAGANILEGMVSLNRGAQGFLMNTASGFMDLKGFLQCTKGNSDPAMRSLFEELDSKYFQGIDLESIDRRPHFVVAVGIGSSAGLDVYGSSQAGIQVILDHDLSYRVLTGSNVIRSVMGEDISNYDIGGAKVMSRWTGVVDMVAKNKFQMISAIRRIHGLFSVECAKPCVQRGESLFDEKSYDFETRVLSENLILPNVDNSDYMALKSDYYGSGALVGGFASLAGRKCLIMGPRSHSGLKSFAAVTRAKELVKIAHKTHSHVIMVSGRKWHDEVELYDNSSIRARLDFIQTLNEFNGVKISIITDVRGFNTIEINSAADIVIFVKHKDFDPNYAEFIERNSSFIVKSFKSAMDIAQRLLYYLDPPVHKHESRAPQGFPLIPEDTNSPYDIVENVINRVFDDQSFVEFFADMNSSKTRSNFITGLAKLEGRTVGILADQPLVMGGGADAIGTEKFRVFTKLLNRFNIPIVMLSNSSGFIPGTKQERLRIQAIGAESLDANILGKTPVVSIVLKQNYGGRQIQAFNKFLRPGITYLAYTGAVMAVLGESVAFDLLKAKKHKAILSEGKEKEAALFRKGFAEGYISKAKAENDGTETGAVDGIIDSPENFRSELIRALDHSEKRCAEAFCE